jgi:hypothetical protein
MKTFKPLQRSILALSLAGSLLLNSGCWLLVVGAVAGAAAVTVAYVDGGLDATYGAPYDKVVAAAEKAVTQLEFAKPDEQKDALSDTFTTHDAKGDRVQIIVTRVSDTSTKVAIRVGAIGDTKGDQAMANSINDKIKANL